MQKKNLLFIIPMLVMLSTPSLGAEAQKQAAPVFNAQGSFDFCVMDHAYPEGNKLSFAMSAQKEINIAALIAQAGFDAHQRYKVSLRLDDHLVEEVDAGAVDEETLIFREGNDPAFLDLLNRAKRLEIAGNNAIVIFPLAAFGHSVEELASCVSKYRLQLKAPLPEMPAALRSLLARAELERGQAISMDEIPPAERPADYVWEADGLTGGYSVKPMDGKLTFDAAVGLYIQGLKKACPKSFEVSLEKTIGNVDFATRLALTSCVLSKTEKVVDSVVFLYEKQKKLLTIVTLEGTDPLRQKVTTSGRAIQKAAIPARIQN